MNVPNKLTVSRVFLVPLFLLFFFSRLRCGVLVSTLIFCVASITDSIDGYLARKNGQITTFGKFMDPLADKLLVASALIGFVEKGYISSLPAIVIIAREFIVTGVRLVAVSENKVIAANSWGKIKTVSQILVIILILLDTSVAKMSVFGVSIIPPCVGLMVAITVYSGFNYVKNNWKLIDVK